MGPTLIFFAPAIESTGRLVVPSLTIFEVFKKILRHKTETEGLMATAAIQQGLVVDLDALLSLEAA